MRLATLFESRTFRDFRHTDHFKELPFWPKGQDPQFIDPNDGFHFVYHEGELILSSTNNDTYSGIVTMGPKVWAEVKASDRGVPTHIQVALKHGGRENWNEFGGLVEFSKKLITISKEHVSNGPKMVRQGMSGEELKQSLVRLKKYGVEDDFVIKGGIKPYNGLTVGEVLLLPDTQFHSQIDSVGKARQIAKHEQKNPKKASALADFRALADVSESIGLNWPDDYTRSVFDIRRSTFYLQRAKENGIWFRGTIDAVNTDTTHEVMTFTDLIKLLPKILKPVLRQMADNGVRLYFFGTSSPITSFTDAQVDLFDKEYSADDIVTQMIEHLSKVKEGSTSAKMALLGVYPKL